MASANCARRSASVASKRGLRLMDSLQREDHASKDAALKYFCLMALNLNEMVYLN